MSKPSSKTNSPGPAPTQREVDDFCDAVKVADHAAVNVYLDKFGPAYVDARCSDRDKTALINAVIYERMDLIVYLLDNGASLDMRSAEGMNARDWASALCNRDMMSFLNLWAENHQKQQEDVKQKERQRKEAQTLAAKQAAEKERMQNLKQKRPAKSSLKKKTP